MVGIEEMSELKNIDSSSHWMPYPVYKDSGVAWLGEIPQHWEARKLKYKARITFSSVLESCDLATG